MRLLCGYHDGIVFISSIISEVMVEDKEMGMGGWGGGGARGKERNRESQSNPE